MQKARIEQILHPLNKLFFAVYVSCFMIGLSGLSSGCKGSRPEQIKEDAKTEKSEVKIDDVKTVEVKTSDAKVEVKTSDTKVEVPASPDSKVDVIVKAGGEEAKK